MSLFCLRARAIYAVTYGDLSFELLSCTMLYAGQSIRISMKKDATYALGQGIIG
jgi:hypothetical protein